MEIGTWLYFIAYFRRTFFTFSESQLAHEILFTEHLITKKHLCFHSDKSSLHLERWPRYKKQDSSPANLSLGTAAGDGATSTNKTAKKISSAWSTVSGS